MAQACQPLQPNMDGTQLAQWLSAQAGNTVGDLQHIVRALMLRASSPIPDSSGDGGGKDFRDRKPTSMSIK